MLQNNYGRLAIISVFIIVVIILMLAPGMNSSKKEEKEMNFTSMPKDSISKNTEAAAPETIVEQTPVQQAPAKKERLISPEEQMLNAWGMNKQEENETAESEEAPVQESFIPAEQVNTQSRNNLSPVEIPESALDNILEQPKADSKPKKKIIKVGSKCFSAPEKTVFMLKHECDTTGIRFGIHSCPAAGVKDEWAGAVRTCGGVDRLPDMDDLLALGRMLYSNTNIYIAEKDRHLFRAYRKYSQTVANVSDNMNFNDLSYKPSAAVSMNLPPTADFTIWGRTEINPEHALAVTFKMNAMTYQSDTPKTSENFYTMCQVECE